MQHVIAKPINTRVRRLRVGDPIRRNDDLSPHTFDDLKARGFITEKGEPAAPVSAFGGPHVAKVV